MKVTICINILLGIPLILFFAVFAELKLVGCWIGLGIALLIITVILYKSYLKINFNNIFIQLDSKVQLEMKKEVIAK